MPFLANGILKLGPNGAEVLMDALRRHSIHGGSWTA
jgi:hypothetical protein